MVNDQKPFTGGVWPLGKVIVYALLPAPLSLVPLASKSV
jgi:hypothetical protein